jgi:hypothetical protein
VKLQWQIFWSPPPPPQKTGDFISVTLLLFNQLNIFFLAYDAVTQGIKTGIMVLSLWLQNVQINLLFMPKLHHNFIKGL